MQRQGFVQRLYSVYPRRLVGEAASIYIDQSGSADPGEWDHFIPTELTELTDIPTISLASYTRAGRLLCRANAEPSSVVVRIASALSCVRFELLHGFILR